MTNKVDTAAVQMDAIAHAMRLARQAKRDTRVYRDGDTFFARLTIPQSPRPQLVGTALAGGEWFTFNPDYTPEVLA